MDIGAILNKAKSTADSAKMALSGMMLGVEIREKGVLRNSVESLSDFEKKFLLYVLNTGSAMVDVTDYGFILEKNVVSMNSDPDMRLTVIAKSKDVISMDTADLIEKIKYQTVKNYDSPIIWYVTVNGSKLKCKSKFAYSDVIYS